MRRACYSKTNHLIFPGCGKRNGGRNEPEHNRFFPLMDDEQLNILVERPKQIMTVIKPVPAQSLPSTLDSPRDQLISHPPECTVPRIKSASNRASQKLGHVFLVVLLSIHD